MAAEKNEAAKLNVGNSKSSTLNCIDKICWNHRFNI